MRPERWPAARAGAGRSRRMLDPALVFLRLEIVGDGQQDPHQARSLQQGVEIGDGAGQTRAAPPSATSPMLALARLLSGWRWRGSSGGSGMNTNSERCAGQVDDRFRPAPAW